MVCRVISLGPLGNPSIITPYLLDDDLPAIVDPGPSSIVPSLLERIRSEGYKESDLAYLLLTHIHVDHAGGAWLLSRHLEKVKILVPTKGLRHLLNPSRLMQAASQILGDILTYWGGMEPIPEERVTAMKDGDSVELGETSIQYIEAPGHAPHHTFLRDGNRRIFAADAMGIYHETQRIVSPTSPPPAFDFDRAVQDIERIRGMNPDVLFLPHFTAVHASPDFFEMTLSVYKNWYNRIKEALNQTVNPEEVLRRITQDYPQYNQLSTSMKKQLTKVDVSGFIDYFKRKSA